MQASNLDPWSIGVENQICVPGMAEADPKLAGQRHG